MPMVVSTEILVFSQPEFHTLSAKLLRIIFDVHNEFGRFLDESLYKNEIAARWVESGYGIAEREVQITVTEFDRMIDNRIIGKGAFHHSAINHSVIPDGARGR